MLNCYLPNRQLRNIDKLVGYMPECYLPNRQLRNRFKTDFAYERCYLPNRQLRNVTDQEMREYPDVTCRIGSLEIPSCREWI